MSIARTIARLALVLGASLASVLEAQNASTTYDFAHLAVGGGFQTTLTYVNYSAQSVSCQTVFYSDSGQPLPVPFAGGAVSRRTDDLAPGADLHAQTQAENNSAPLTGWAQAQCTGPVKASLLYRLYNGGVAVGEAGVNATTTPATEFATFAQTQTGIAYANPSNAVAIITITALDTAGALLGNRVVALQPNAHGAAVISTLLGLKSFTGSVHITSTGPIISLSLNAEAFPVFSSLPPGDLPNGTPLAGQGAAAGSPSATTYDFPHLAVGGGYETTLTYVNYSPGIVNCQTSFYADSGQPLEVPFAGGAVTRRADVLGPGASLHVQTQANDNSAVITGWAQAQCTGAIEASLLYRLYEGGIAQGEAGVNATTAPAIEFATFAQTQTGIAYANPSSVPATITFTALDTAGARLGRRVLGLPPNAHGAAVVSTLLGLKSFTGSVHITSTEPIVSLSLNAEAFPVFSSLPPGDLPSGTVLAAQASRVATLLARSANASGTAGTR